LPDVVEAYLGAIFIDSNSNFSVVEEFYHQYVQSFFYDMTVYDTFANKHPTVCHNLATEEWKLTLSRHSCMIV
jgi:endoribonuclease Dicer